MAKKAHQGLLSPQAVLQLVVALFLITLGIVGIINYNSDLNQFTRAVAKAFGGRDNVLNMVIAITELVSGIIIGGALFVSSSKNLLFLASFIVLALWIIRILYFFFLNNIFEPDFLIWLNRLSLDLVVGASLWIVSRRYA
jgi:hypothetical protein